MELKKTIIKISWDFDKNKAINNKERCQSKVKGTQKTNREKSFSFSCNQSLKNSLNNYTFLFFLTQSEQFWVRFLETFETIISESPSFRLDAKMYCFHFKKIVFKRSLFFFVPKRFDKSSQNWKFVVDMQLFHTSFVLDF